MSILSFYFLLDMSFFEIKSIDTSLYFAYKERDKSTFPLLSYR